MAAKIELLEANPASLRIIGGTFGASGKATISAGFVNIESAADANYPIEAIEKVSYNSRQRFAFKPWGLVIGATVALTWAYFFGPNGLLAGLVFAGLVSFGKVEIETSILQFPHALWVEVIE